MTRDMSFWTAMVHLKDGREKLTASGQEESKSNTGVNVVNAKQRLERITAFINDKEISVNQVDGAYKKETPERSAWLEHFYSSFGPIIISAYQVLTSLS